MNTFPLPSITRPTHAIRSHWAAAFARHMPGSARERVGTPVASPDTRVKLARDYDIKTKQAIVDVAITFIANAAKLWEVSSLEDRQQFKKMIYPGGIPYLSEGGFGAAIMGLCYEEIKLIQAEKQKEAATGATSSDQNDTLVTPTGLEPVLSA